MNAEDLPVAFIFREIVKGRLVKQFFALCIKARKIKLNQGSVVALAEYFDAFYRRVLPATSFRCGK